MFNRFLKKFVLQNFLNIELSSFEKKTALLSIEQKYSIAFKKMVIFSLLSIFPILFLDVSVIISVLIPITMVAGTAWFSISLANMRQKFENFGLELTKNLFESFSISLGLLFTLSIFSLTTFLWKNYIENIGHTVIWQTTSALIGIFIVGAIVYKIFIGSIKYDINDAMLAGQNEAAEKFFRKSLSLLHSVADTLRSGKSLSVANYYIGVAFFEIFAYMKQIGIMNGKLAGFIEESNKLVKNPSMNQKIADKIALSLIKIFVSYCKNSIDMDSKKSLEAICDELWCLEHNINEEQEIIDTRLAIIFQEIASLLEGQGETLFISNNT